MKGLLEQIKYNRILYDLVIKNGDIYFSGNLIVCERCDDGYVIYFDDIEDYLNIKYKDIHYILLDYIDKKFGLYVRDYHVTLLNDTYEISLEEYEKNY